MPTPSVFRHCVAAQCARIGALAASVFAILAIAGCQSLPLPHVPSLAEKQVQTLKTLGFEKNDEGWLLDLPEPIYFEFGKAVPKPDLKANIAPIAEELLRVDIRKLRIEGHSDNAGPRDFNRELSQRRADAVAREFAEQGFADNNVERIGFGPDHPIADNRSREGRAQNRRVEIIVPVGALRAL